MSTTSSDKTCLSECQDSIDAVNESHSRDNHFDRADSASLSLSSHVSRSWKYWSENSKEFQIHSRLSQDGQIPFVFFKVPEAGVEYVPVHRVVSYAAALAVTFHYLNIFSKLIPNRILSVSTPMDSFQSILSLCVVPVLTNPKCARLLPS